MMLPAPYIALSVVFFLFGTLLGSFGNVVILRGIKGRSLGGRSQCPSCCRILEPWELIPIVSYFLVLGRCRTCKYPLTIQYPLVEAASGGLFALAPFIAGFDLIPSVLIAMALWLLLLLCIFDAKTGFIPDALNIPFVILSVIRAFLLPVFPWWAILVGGGFFAIQWIVSRGKWVGSGDIILAAGIGALVGSLELLLFSLFTAYVTGAVVAIVLLSQKKKNMESSIAFGPFLGLGCLVALVAGEQVLKMVIGI